MKISKSVFHTCMFEVQMSICGSVEPAGLEEI